MDLGSVYTAQPTMYYNLDDIHQEALAVAHAMVKVEVKDSNVPGEYEILLDLHDAYSNARTVAIRTDEAMSALTKMAQLFGRTENTVPAITPTFSRQISQVSNAGMTPQRIVDRCASASLMTMLIRLRSDVGFEVPLGFAASGTPVVQRPNSWNEFLFLVGLEASGKVVFPATCLEETTSNPVPILEVWALLLSRSIRLEDGGVPYLPCWPSLTPSGEQVHMAVRMFTFGVASSLTIVQLWDAITAFLDVYDLTPTFTARLKFFLTMQVEIYAPKEGKSFSPFEGVRLSKMTAPFRTVTMAFSYFCRFSRKSIINCFDRKELQWVLIETFLGGASVALSLKVTFSAAFDVLMRKYIKVAEEKMASSYVDRKVREFVVTNFHRAEGGISL